MRLFTGIESRAQAVVTMPTLPSALGGALPSMGRAHASLISTHEAFERVADAATVSLTIMSPFLNEDGLRWAIQIFRRTTALHRRLIVRAVPGCHQVLASLSEEVRQLGVEVLSYSRPSADRAAYETFHAKVALADSSLVYVGSANLLAYRQQSMELGILADGRAAEVVAEVVRGVESVADRVAL
jgi:hypothetical protein